MHIDLNQETVSSWAKNLCSQFQKRGVSVSHTESLAIIGSFMGLKNQNALMEKVKGAGKKPAGQPQIILPTAGDIAVLKVALGYADSHVDDLVSGVEENYYDDDGIADQAERDLAAATQVLQRIASQAGVSYDALRPEDSPARSSAASDSADEQPDYNVDADAAEGDGEDGEDEGEPTLLLNRYVCYSCGYHWEDKYECGVDDDCPHCNARHCSPYQSDDESAEDIFVDPDWEKLADQINAAFAEHPGAITVTVKAGIHDEIPGVVLDINGSSEAGKDLSHRRSIRINWALEFCSASYPVPTGSYKDTQPRENDEPSEDIADLLDELLSDATAAGRSQDVDLLSHKLSDISEAFLAEARAEMKKKGVGI